jgi:hypothetical protein
MWMSAPAGSLLALLCLAAPLAAQREAAGPPHPAGAAGPCAGATRPAGAYMDCALGIAPVWNGLAVVRGPATAPVATLGFFWPRSVAGAFAGDSAVAAATRALHVRRAAAGFTDAGAVLLAVASVRGLRAGRLDATGRAFVAAGAGSFAVGVPLQFSADAWLSRAVWWHNVAYGR